MTCSMLMNASDLFAWNEDLSLFGADDLLKSSVASDEEHRHNDHDGRSELQKLLEGTTDYNVSPLTSPTTHVAPPSSDHTAEPLSLPLCNEDIGWSETMVNLLDFASSDLVSTKVPLTDCQPVPSVMTEQLACLSPPRIDNFTTLQLLTSNYTISEKLANHADVAFDSDMTGSGVYPNLFDDVLGMCADDIDNTIPDISYDAVLSPVSVEDVESLLASEPSSPLASPSVNPKKRGRRRADTRPYERVSSATSQAKIADRKLRKKEQNKVAALRYREKKRVESGAICDEETALEKRNETLRMSVDKLEREVQYLKDFMDDVARAKTHTL